MSSIPLTGDSGDGPGKSPIGTECEFDQCSNDSEFRIVVRQTISSGIGNSEKVKLVCDEHLDELRSDNLFRVVDVSPSN